MKTKSCVYCGDACEETTPLTWSISEKPADQSVNVRLNLCERCSRSWIAFADDFCPKAEPEIRSASKKKKKRQQ